METQTFYLRHCIERYNNLNRLSNKELKYMYDRLVEEYNINIHLVNTLPIVKTQYYMYLNNIFIPHINYMAYILSNKGIDIKGEL